MPEEEREVGYVEIANDEDAAEMEQEQQEKAQQAQVDVFYVLSQWLLGIGGQHASNLTGLSFHSQQTVTNDSSLSSEKLQQPDL